MKVDDTPSGLSASKAVVSADGNMAITVSSHMISGILFYGGLGWLLSRWFGNESLFIAGGVILGAAFSTYLVIIRLRQMPAPDQRVFTDTRGGR